LESDGNCPAHHGSAQKARARIVSLEQAVSRFEGGRTPLSGQLRSLLETMPREGMIGLDIGDDGRRLLSSLPEDPANDDPAGAQREREFLAALRANRLVGIVRRAVGDESPSDIIAALVVILREMLEANADLDLHPIVMGCIAEIAMPPLDDD
jgi:hypothetical protein